MIVLSNLKANKFIKKIFIKSINPRNLINYQKHNLLNNLRLLINT
jgi:hypothetical protein